MPQSLMPGELKARHPQWKSKNQAGLLSNTEYQNTVAQSLSRFKTSDLGPLNLMLNKVFIHMVIIDFPN